MLVELEAELLLRHPRPIEPPDLPDAVSGDEAGLIGRGHRRSTAVWAPVIGLSMSMGREAPYQS